MVGMVIFIIVTLLVPVILGVYAVIKRQLLPFILGVIAFTLSQVCIRIPLLNLLATESTFFALLQATQPILTVAILALSAALFEESARWVAMRFFMKQRKLSAAIYFGFGHGGIEALLIVGLPVMLQYVLLATPISQVDFYLSTVERIGALVVHIGLSIIIFYGVQKRSIKYYLWAITLHTLVNFSVSIAASHVSTIVAEVVMVVFASLILLYSLKLLRRFKDETI